ncbi:hypothetical protein OG349_19265 [Streptomyces sp. NBC_01317]|nr:hypothetical protein OG349_19265 [Streptomyces sp. NBC_01317]
MQTVGWSSPAMAARYQHVIGGILVDIAPRADRLIRQAEETDGSR